jgi:hypothetical protein
MIRALMPDLTVAITYLEDLAIRLDLDSLRTIVREAP